MEQGGNGGGGLHRNGRSDAAGGLLDGGIGRSLILASWTFLSFFNPWAAEASARKPQIFRTRWIDYWLVAGSDYCPLRALSESGTGSAGRLVNSK